MRFTTALFLLAILASCGAEVGEPSPPSDGEKSRPIPLVAEAQRGEPPHIVTKPDLQPGNILGEKMNFSRVDMSVKLDVTIDQSGAVVATSLASVSPPDSGLAREFGQFVMERFRSAVFETSHQFSYPHSFEVAVNYPAPRDAAGRLK